MEVTYRNRFRDLLWFNLYQAPRIRIYQILSGLYLLFMGYIAFDIMRSAQASFTAKVISAVMIISGFLLAMLVFQFVLLCLSILTSRHHRQLVQRDSKLSLSDYGLLEDCATGRMEVKWSGIDKVSQSGDYILINLSDQAACVVPKRAFADEAEANRFFAYAYQHWNEARHK